MAKAKLFDVLASRGHTQRWLLAHVSLPPVPAVHLQVLRTHHVCPAMVLEITLHAATSSPVPRHCRAYHKDLPTVYVHIDVEPLSCHCQLMFTAGLQISVSWTAGGSVGVSVGVVVGVAVGTGGRGVGVCCTVAVAVD